MQSVVVEIEFEVPDTVNSKTVRQAAEAAIEGARGSFMAHTKVQEGDGVAVVEATWRRLVYGGRVRRRVHGTPNPVTDPVQ